MSGTKCTMCTSGPFMCSTCTTGPMQCLPRHSFLFYEYRSSSKDKRCQRKRPHALQYKYHHAKECSTTKSSEACPTNRCEDHVLARMQISVSKNISYLPMLATTVMMMMILPMLGVINTSHNCDDNDYDDDLAHVVHH